MTLGNRIKTARKRLRMSQAVLAQRTKVDQSSIAYWESGRTSPKYARLMELAEILEVTPEWLQFGINSAGSNTSVPLVATIGLPGCNKDPVMEKPEQSVELGMGPDSDDCIAVAIRGNALTPAYMDGDVLVGERQTPESILQGISADCIIGMKDGRTLLARAPVGRSQAHYPITNPANVAWVMQVTWIRRGPVKPRASSDSLLQCSLNSEDVIAPSYQPMEVAAS